jgi:hypothetical protein
MFYFTEPEIKQSEQPAQPPTTTPCKSMGMIPAENKTLLPPNSFKLSLY